MNEQKKILMPQRLTAENGAKGLFSGEFYAYKQAIDCPWCEAQGCINQMKDTVHWRMGNGDKDKQHVHLPKSLQQDDDFIKQFLSEEKQRNRNGRYVWVRIRKDNHLFDTTVYAHAMADFQCMGGVRVLAAPLYASPEPQPAPVKKKKKKKQRGGRW